MFCEHCTTSTLVKMLHFAGLASKSLGLKNSHLARVGLQVFPVPAGRKAERWEHNSAVTPVTKLCISSAGTYFCLALFLFCQISVKFHTFLASHRQNIANSIQTRETLQLHKFSSIFLIWRLNILSSLAADVSAVIGCEGIY